MVKQLTRICSTCRLNSLAGQEQQLVHGLLIFKLSTLSSSVCIVYTSNSTYSTSTQAKIINVIELDNNEAAFSLAIVSFSVKGGELHLVVGTAADMLVSP
jgi:hypothetical protein